MNHECVPIIQREKNPKFKTRLQAQLTKLEQATRSEQERRKRSMVADEIRVREKNIKYN